MSSLYNAHSAAVHLTPQLSAPTMPPTAEHSSFNASSHIPLLSSSSPRFSGPSQAAEAVKTRRRASAPRGNSKDNTNCPFTLPPPPTRSRKIIQMRPRTQADSTGTSPAKSSGRAGSKTAKTATNKDTSDSGSESTGQGVKRKQPPNATSAAGRKTARKTAHSLIERRRRGKMNEEFDVLRSLVPACTLQMHKLSVLNVSYFSNVYVKIIFCSCHFTSGASSILLKYSHCPMCIPFIVYAFSALVCLLTLDVLHRHYAVAARSPPR